jgi:type VII secretion protein EccE
MKARAVAVRPALTAVVAAELVGLTALVVFPPHRAGWWPAPVIAVLTFLALAISVHRRNVPGWVVALARHRLRRPAPVAAAVDVPHGAIVCGVRVDQHEAVTTIRLTGRPYALTLLRGSALSLTNNVVPGDVLAGLLDQPGGLHVALDIVSAGQRVRRAEGYPPLYSTLLADRPAAGQRTTHLVVRLDIADSVPALSYRASIGAAAAAATERIINALLQEGIRATALSADELDATLVELSAGLVSAPQRPAGHGGNADQDGQDSDDGDAGAARIPPAQSPRPRLAPKTRWRTIRTRAGHLATYYFSPEDITTAGLNHMWALHSDDIVQTTSIVKRRTTRPAGGGPVLVSAMVRTCDPQPPANPPTLNLNPLPGDQYAAALRAAPTVGPPMRLPGRYFSASDPLDIPIGATGILVGAAVRDDSAATPAIQRDDLVMLALTDPHRATRVSIDTTEFYVRQLLIRAAAVGERIAIYSHQPSRWNSLTQPNIAVAERRGSPEFVPTITVNDRPTALSAAGLSATVITLGAAESSHPPDLQFVQTSDSTVQISTPTQSVEVAIVAFRQEQAWMGLG